MKGRPSAVTGQSLMGERSDIGVQNAQKILFGAEKGWSHKTSWSLIRGSFVAGTTVYIFSQKFRFSVVNFVSEGIYWWGNSLSLMGNSEGLVGRFSPPVY